MEALRRQIEQDSSDDDEEEPDTAPKDTKSPTNIGLCMALKLNDYLPRTWKQAISEPHWYAAMKKEINELVDKAGEGRKYKIVSS